MSSTITEKADISVSITQPEPSRQLSMDNNRLLSATVDDGDSGHTLTPTTSRGPPREKDSSYSRDASPSSAFYLHPTTRYSLEASRTESKNNLAIYETDLEAGNTLSATNTNNNALIQSKTNKDCTIWPGQKTLKANHKIHRRKGAINPFRNLNKKNKIIAKTIVALVLVGLAVGIGVGVSKAVGGGVWKNNDSSAPIHNK